MEVVRVIEVLEALASGCSPATGELVHSDSILNQREVIRALQYAIDHLKLQNGTLLSEVQDLDISDLQRVIQLFGKSGKTPTAYNLAAFYLGTRRFQNSDLVTDSSYGKLRGKYTKGMLIDYFSQNVVVNLKENSQRQNIDYSQIDYFQKEKFNKLSSEAISQLKSKVKELGILKIENLSVSVQNARKNHPRAYEVWSEKEVELLRTAIKYTNDLDLLSECFQRGKGSIESYGQRLIFESLKQEPV